MKSSNLQIIHSKDEYSRGKLIIINGLPTIEFVDDYEHFDLKIEYIVENIIFEPTLEIRQTNKYKKLNKLFNTILNNSCDCNNETNCNISNSHSYHSSNYIINKNQLNDNKELILNPERPSKHLIYECSINCKCLGTCQNRLVQYGPRQNLQIIQSKHLPNQQKCLITTKPIPTGGFVCEYAGEIITKEEANRRIRLCQNLKNNKENVMNYVICLNEYLLGKDRDNYQKELPIQTFIDPSHKGNIGRYLNHSCKPNCEILSVRTDGPIPKLAIFTKRDIKSFEELCFHYGGEESIKTELKENDRIPCLCREENCEKYLPNFKF